MPMSPKADSTASDLNSASQLPLTDEQSALLDERLREHRANPDAADDREVHRWRRGVLWRRNGGRKKGPLPVPLDATHDQLGSVGTGVFGGWRNDVGNELDHDLHATMI